MDDAWFRVGRPLYGEVGWRTLNECVDSAQTDGFVTQGRAIYECLVIG